MFWNSRIKQQQWIIEQQRKNIDLLKSEILSLKLKNESQNRSRPTLPKIEYLMEEPSPIDREEREQYLAKVVGFYTDILRKKILHLISEQQNRLADPTLTREQDLYHKATINALALLLDWGDDCEAEYLQVIKDKNESEN